MLSSIYETILAALDYFRDQCIEFDRPDIPGPVLYRTPEPVKGLPEYDSFWQLMEADISDWTWKRLDSFVERETDFSTLCQVSERDWERAAVIKERTIIQLRQAEAQHNIDDPPAWAAAVYHDELSFDNVSKRSPAPRGSGSGKRPFNPDELDSPTGPVTVRAANSSSKGQTSKRKCAGSRGCGGNTTKKMYTVSGKSIRSTSSKKL